MEDYNKIIESLEVKFKKARNINILKPITVENYYDVENLVLLVKKGQVKYGKEKKTVRENEILFIPGARMLPVTYGSGEAVSLSNDDFLNHREKYFQQSNSIVNGGNLESFCYLTFEAKVFDSVNFFASLDIPPFIIKEEDVLKPIIEDIIYETYADTPGKARVIKLKTDQLVIETIRYLINNNLFVEQLATNVTYFKDPRLIDLFSYIRDNLGFDLSNKKLSSIANVSEDYVGQYFKMLTGINPQDYIEYQRMEEAVNLLRTSKKSIREIGREVGYKDTAYFCRRFKMMFGIPAGKMRRRESLMNV